MTQGFVLLGLDHEPVYKVGILNDYFEYLIESKGEMAISTKTHDSNRPES